MPEQQECNALHAGRLEAKTLRQANRFCYTPLQTTSPLSVRLSLTELLYKAACASSSGGGGQGRAGWPRSRGVAARAARLPGLCMARMAPPSPGSVPQALRESQGDTRPFGCLWKAGVSLPPAARICNSSVCSSLCWLLEIKHRSKCPHPCQH